jgi:flagellar biosynthesis anti-sigma factor FlgM
MSIGQIKADGGVNPLKEQHVEQLHARTQNQNSDVKKENITNGGDTVTLSDRARLMQEVEKFKKDLESVPSVNEGRIAELKSSIADGSFMTDQAIKETANRLADQLFS